MSDINLLKLPKTVICKVEELCREAVACFKGLNYAEWTSFLEVKLEPVIIEINAQGDLIYQDIYTRTEYTKSTNWDGELWTR